MIRQTVNLNQGIYLEDDLQNGLKTDFCIGVAGYPEKHYKSPNWQADLSYLKQKVDAGANYIVTQMFFDNQRFFDFVKACRETGITVPIIPGLKPITQKSQIQNIPGVFHVTIPEALQRAVDACSHKEDVKKVGAEWLIQQCKELIDFGVPCLHFYTMSNAEPFRAIMKAIG